jgi:hypothetical protein
MLIKEVREIFVKRSRIQCENQVGERVLKERIRMLIVEDSIFHNSQVDNGILEGATDADQEEEEMLGINILKRIKGLRNLSFKRNKQEEIDQPIIHGILSSPTSAHLSKRTIAPPLPRRLVMGSGRKHRASTS